MTRLERLDELLEIENNAFNALMTTIDRYMEEMAHMEKVFNSRHPNIEKQLTSCSNKV